MPPFASAGATLVDLLLARSQHAPDQRAFLFLPDGESEGPMLTYGALAAHACAIGAYLQQQQIGHEPVLLVCPTGPEFVMALFGCLFAGAVAVPVPVGNARRTLAPLTAIAQQTGARMALTTIATQNLLAPHLPENPALQRLLWQPVDILSPPLSSSWRPPSRAATANALLQYTSGSTSAPKGIMLTHSNLLANVAQIQQCCALGPEDIGVFWLPLYHDMGIIGALLETVYVQGFSVLLPPVAFTERPSRWLAAISRYRATISTAPNFAYALCTERITPEQRATLDLHTWRIALCGAEPVQATTLTAFSRTFAGCGFHPQRLRPTYGLAEATLMVTCSEQLMLGEAASSVPPQPHHTADQPLVACGQPVAGTELCIVDVAQRICLAAGHIGEIWVRGPSVALGYWQDAAATAATFGAMLADTGDGPFLRTGDLGFLQAGQLYITGRLKEMIIIRGRTFHPSDIEAVAIASHPALEPLAGAAFGLTAAVHALDGAVMGEEEQLVVLCERRRSARQVDSAEIAIAIRRAVAAAWGLDIYVVGLLRPGSLPRTTSGKIQRYRCRELLRATALPGVEALQYARSVTSTMTALADGAPVAAYVLSFLAEHLGLPVTALDLTQPLLTLGLGSLQAALLRTRLEEHLGIVIPIEWFLTEMTLGEFIARAAELRSSIAP